MYNISNTLNENIILEIDRCTNTVVFGFVRLFVSFSFGGGGEGEIRNMGDLDFQ